MARVGKADASPGTSRAMQVEAIMAEHEGALLRYAARILNNADTAQDVVQNVFIKLFRGGTPPALGADQLKSWLYRVTHNEAVDHIRRESRLQLLHTRQAEEAPPECPDGRHCPGSREEERRALVLQHLRRLDDREQQVLLLRLEEGLSYRAISDVTGRTEGNVGNILHHAVRKLSESLRRAGCIETMGTATAKAQP
jgi:RNA polymerase sigma-70 factor (ECF subfamily)